VQRPLVVMISSRCRTLLAEGGTMTELRRDMKAAVEGLLRADDRISVWINEDSAAIEGSSSWAAESMEEVRKADVVLVLFSADAGSTPKGGLKGVCHLELDAALADAPTKVRAVDVRALLASTTPPAGAHHAPFVAAFEALELMTRQPTTRADAVDDAVDAVADAVHELALAGIVSARRGRSSLGAALSWRRLPFAERKAAMEAAAVATLVAIGADEVRGAPNRVVLELGVEPVLLHVTAAPEGLGLAASRELVGQPPRDDHKRRVADLEAAVGPVHVLLCPEGVTPAQARALLGASELVVVTTATGVWAADAVSRSQVLFVRGCADSSSTENQVKAAFDWLARSGEVTELVARARRRRLIVRAMEEPA
jgi:hypothetical protein